MGLRVAGPWQTVQASLTKQRTCEAEENNVNENPPLDLLRNHK